MTRLQMITVVAGLLTWTSCSKGGADSSARPAGASQGDEVAAAEYETGEAMGKPTDSQILNILELVDSAEIKQGQIATSKARAAQVQQFASHMIQQHTDAKQKGSELAQQAHLTPTSSSISTELHANTAQVMGTLNTTQPPEFDATYIDSQIRQHQEVLDLLKGRLIPAAQSQQVAELLKTAQGMVENHLREAERIKDALDDKE